MEQLTSVPSGSSPGVSPSSKKFLPLIVGAILVIIVLIAGVTIMQNRQNTYPQQANEQKQTMEPTTAPAGDKKVAAFPQVAVSNWVVPSTLSVQAPQTARVYQFKQNLTTLDFSDIASQFFSVNAVDENDRRVVAYSTQTGASMVYMQKTTGSFLYTSDRGADLTASGAAGMTTYVRSLLKDNSLTLAGEYSKTTDPGVRYYEFHRDWDIMGLPILNLLGLFNTSSTVKLSNLTQASTAGRAANAAYTDTTDSADGLERANDFNTVTVGVKEGKVKSVTSNIRPFALAGGASPVITYAQAVEKLKDNNYSYIHTSPAGSGALDRDKLYPNNKASLTSATVTDVTVAYLEELPNVAQTQMIPYYVFKGTGDTSNGYKVNFLAAVPAVTSGVLGTQTTNTALMAQNSLTGVPVGASSSQQQGTIKFNPKGGILPGSTPVGGTLTPGQCQPPPSPQDLINVQRDAAGIVFGQAPKNGFEGGDDYDQEDLEWFVVPEVDWDVAKLQEAAEIVWNNVTGNQVDSDDVKVRRMQKVVSDFEEQSAGCPVRLTGSSPTIFVYGSESVTIVPQTTITYSEPVLGTGWTVTGETQDYLYYEYAPISFTRPKTGWNVTKGELNILATDIARKLGLNAAEAKRLAFELNHAAQDVTSDTIFVGRIDAAELDAKLPLSVSSAGSPNVNRVHFYVGRAAGSVSAPNIQPVARSPFYLLELGAAAE